jgi:hypothetical protein
VYGSSSSPPNDYISAQIALDKRGTLLVQEKSPLNWTLIITQVVAGWTFAVAIFGFFFGHKLERHWSLPWRLAFLSEKIYQPEVSQNTDLYP